MEPRTLQALLRVLYTVNNNPQYILAKSASQVPAMVCGEPITRSATNESTYARVPLKACIAAVCDSSPELLQDRTRDFSLYVLDPLEAQPPPTNLIHAPHNTSSPRGVAVALGLMSWALESTDSTNVLVTGTIIPNVTPALEVIFALRETKRVPKPILQPYPSLGSIYATGSSQPLNLPPPQVAWTNGFSGPRVQHDQQEQKTLTRSVDFPELYIGPPRRAPGRPEGSTSKSKFKSQTSISSLPGNSSKGADRRSGSKQEVGRKSKQRTKPRQPRVPPTYSPFICEPLACNSTADETGLPAFCQKSYPFGQSQSQSQAPRNAHACPTQNPLLGLLSAIPFTSSSNTGGNTAPASQVALLSALQGLLAANPHLLQLVTMNMGSSATIGEQTTGSSPMHGVSKVEEEDGDADSDIVILDSSTVDTAAFRKPSHKKAPSDTDTSPPAINQDSPMHSVQDITASPLPAGTPPSAQEGTLASSQTSTLTIIPEAKTPTSKHICWKQMANRNAPSQAADILVTPTPSQVRKRKLDEYIQDEVYSSIPSSPPSPSPPATRMSGTKRATVTQVLSSPIRGAKSMTSSSARLPSMLASMRSMATLAPRLQVTRGRPASSLSNKNGDLPLSGLSMLTTDHPEILATSSNVASDTAPLKRKLNLNLNEVMEAQEARKNIKVRKQPSSGRKLEGDASAAFSQAGSSQLAPASRHARSSPPRSLFRSNPVPSSFQAPIWQPGLESGTGHCDPPTAGIVSTSTSTTTPTKNPLKNFVMPAWARTSTAMLPRLSDEALARQQAEREAKKTQMSLRRREAAKSKRKRLRDAEYPSKESSDEDEDAMTNDPKRRPSSSVAGSAPLPPPEPSLPVFASDAVAPISSPPRTHQRLPPVPSTPPRKQVSPTPKLHHTPNKTGSCSLFTPSGQEPGSLFTPSTPSVTRPLTRTAFTPRSPTVRLHSGTRISPRKSVLQTPWTPKRNASSHQTPRSLRSGRSTSFPSPSWAIRMPETQMGVGTRAFLLPPPSPCTSRMPRHESQLRSKAPGSAAPLITEDSSFIKQESPDEQDVGQDKDSKEEGAPGCTPDDGLLRTETSASPIQHRATHDTAPNPDAGDEYAPSPLPPSSPLPASPFSSPVKHNDSDVDVPPMTNLVSNSDSLLPSTNDLDGSKEVMDTSWLTESEAQAWLTEADAWLTDTEGGPLLTDSDGAWLSDSDAVFGDMSSLPPSSASNWFSDDADIDTDGETGAGAMIDPDGALDTTAFERAFAALVQHGGRSIDKGESADSGAAGTHGAKVESEFWESIRPLLGENAVDSVGITAGNVVEFVDANKVAQDLQALLNGLVGS